MKCHGTADGEGRACGTCKLGLRHVKPRAEPRYSLEACSQDGQVVVGLERGEPVMSREDAEGGVAAFRSWGKLRSIHVLRDGVRVRTETRTPAGWSWSGAW